PRARPSPAEPARTPGNSGPSRQPRRRGRCRRERLLHHAQHLLASALQDRLQATEVEPSQLDGPGPTKGAETEVGEKVNREDRPRSEEHTSELQSLRHLVCRLL